jgi:hypothetical protein
LPYQFFRARARFRRALVSKFTILSIDFNGAVQRECFLAAYAWKLMWGLPAAMTEFSLNLTVKFGIQEIVVALFGCRLERYVWSTFSQGRTNYLPLLFRFAIFVYWTSNSKRNPKKRKDEPAQTGESGPDLI